MEQANRTMHKRTLIGLGIFLLICQLIVTFLNDAVRKAAELYSALPDGNAWFVHDHLATLYLLTPLSTTAMTTVLVMPGILLVLARGIDVRPGELVLKGFGLSFLLHVTTTSAVKLLTGDPVTPLLFTALLAATLLACFGWLVAHSGGDNRALQVFTDTDDRRQLGWLLAIPLLFVCLLLPSILWQELNSDGFEAMEIGRSLTSTLLPAFPNKSGTMGLGIGMVPMAYPVSWFILLTGPLEAATRLPMAIYLMVLFAALLALIEHDAPRRLRPVEEAVVLLALAIYTTTMSFNSGYNNYYTDMSSPAAFETLTIVFMLASGWFLWTGRYTWFLLFTFAGFLARPTVLLFVMLLGAGIALVSEKNRTPPLIMIGVAIGLWVALLAGYEHIYLASISGDSGSGYPAASILYRFQYLTFDDYQRFIYAAAPAGLLPALSLLAYRMHDPLSRCLVIISAGYFLVFYIPAFTSLHHFVPVMIIPVIVLWRLVIRNTVSFFPAAVTGAMALLCLWLSLPKHFQVTTTYSDIGKRMEYQIGKYNGDYPSYRQSIAGTNLFSNYFRADWDVDDPATELVGGDQLLYYASHGKSPGQVIDYMIQPANAAPPAGFTLLARESAGSAWVRDTTILEKDRHNPPPTGYRSDLYDISPETLFFYKGVPAHNYSINLSSLPLLWRLFQKSD